MTDQPTITVDATGTASAPPDVARVRLFTFAEDPAAGDALTSCSLLTDRVLTAIRDAGVAASDTQTTSIDLNFQHRRDADETVQSYRASSSFVVTVRPPEDAGRIVAAAVGAAGSGVGINGVSFDIDDRTALTSRARRDAVAGAVRAAAELADAAEVVLGPLVGLVEGGGWRPFQPRGAVRMAAVAASAPPVEIGELGVSVSVSAVFEVVPRPSG